MAVVELQKHTAPCNGEDCSRVGVQEGSAVRTRIPRRSHLCDEAEMEEVKKVHKESSVSRKEAFDKRKKTWEKSVEIGD